MGWRFFRGASTARALDRQRADDNDASARGATESFLPAIRIFSRLAPIFEGTGRGELAAPRDENRPLSRYSAELSEAGDEGGHRIPYLLIAGCLLLVTGSHSFADSDVTKAYVFLTAYSTFAVNVKRCHDYGYSAWLVLLWVLMPPIGIIAQGIVRGKDVANDYGPPLEATTSTGPQQLFR